MSNQCNKNEGEFEMMTRLNDEINYDILRALNARDLSEALKAVQKYLEDTVIALKETDADSRQIKVLETIEWRISKLIGSIDAICSRDASYFRKMMTPIDLVYITMDLQTPGIVELWEKVDRRWQYDEAMNLLRDFREFLRATIEYSRSMSLETDEQSQGGDNMKVEKIEKIIDKSVEDIVSIPTAKYAKLHKDGIPTAKYAKLHKDRMGKEGYSEYAKRALSHLEKAQEYFANGITLLRDKSYKIYDIWAMEDRERAIRKLIDSIHIIEQNEVEFHFKYSVAKDAEEIYSKLGYIYDCEIEDMGGEPLYSEAKDHISFAVSLIFDAFN